MDHCSSEGLQVLEDFGVEHVEVKPPTKRSALLWSDLARHSGLNEGE